MKPKNKFGDLETEVIKQKLNENHLLITIVDNGSAVVIIKEEDYIEKN